MQYTQLSRRSAGGNKIDWKRRYLTFEALEGGTFTLTIGDAVTTKVLKNISYSIDNGKTWTTTNNVESTEVVITTPFISAGDKVLWKGRGTSMAVRDNASSIFSSTGLFDVYGSLLSLFLDDDFKGKTVIGKGDIIYYHSTGLFRDSKVVNAENLVLPANLGLSVFAYTFMNCVNLITAPVIPRTDTTFQSCYEQMFRNCTSLVKAPDLLAPSIGARSYWRMFYGCSSLNYVKCLATSMTTNYPTVSWLSGVASTGTFVKAAGMEDWTTGGNGIPSGWTVVDDNA